MLMLIIAAACILHAGAAPRRLQRFHSRTIHQDTRGPSATPAATDFGGYGGAVDGLYGPGSMSPQICSCATEAVPAPVCASDGETYESACLALCAGVEPIAPGRCIKGCYCARDVVEPRCGNGVTYQNDCLFNCGVPPEFDVFSYRGECKPNCNCTLEEEEGCAVATGPQGESYYFEYGNSCVAACGLPDAEWVPTSCYDLMYVDYDCDSYSGDYDPDIEVCGTDGVTYANGRVTHCIGIPVAYMGPCETNCDCGDAPPVPVCGKDGVTYPSACAARCKPTGIVFEGECTAECTCTASEFAPVCGRNGNTYINECFALRCNLAEIGKEGECPDDYSFVDYGGGDDYAGGEDSGGDYSGGEPSNGPSPAGN